MGGRVRDIDRGYKRLVREVLGTRQGAAQQFSGLTVGIFDDVDPDAPRKMLINEAGVPELNIPSRPALAATFDRNRAPIYLAFAKAYGKALLRRGSAREAGLEAAGQLLARRLYENIAGWSNPRNADSTIARKGFNDPLVEFGGLLSSVGYRVTTGPIRRDF